MDKMNMPGSSQKFLEEPAKELIRTQNTYRISLGTAILLSIIAAISLIATIQTQLYSFLGIIVTTLIAIAAFVSAYLSRKNLARLGATILISTILILSLLLPFLAKGQGLILGVVVVILVSGLASATLESKWSTRATLAALGVGIAITLVDLFTPSNFGSPTDPRFILPIAILLTIIYTIFLATRFRNFTLRSKLIISFIIVALVPLALLGYQNYRNTYALLSSETNTNLLNTASLTAKSVDNFINTELDSIRTDSQIPTIIEYIAMPEDKRQGSPQEKQAQKTLQALQRKDPVYISSYAILDQTGKDILDTYKADIGVNKANRAYFAEPFARGQPFVSPIATSETSAERSLYFSAPLRTKDGRIIGVLRVRYNSAILQELLFKSLNENRTVQYAVLVDNQFFIRLAHTDDPTTIFKSYGNIPTALAQELQKEGRLSTGAYSSVVGNLQSTAKAIEAIDKQPIFTSPDAEHSEVDMISAGVRLENKPDWVVLVREPAASALQPVTNQTRASVLLSLLAAFMAAGAAILMAQFLSAPIIKLTRVAEKVSAGNLNAQAIVENQDEIGALANTFNNMTSQLKQILGGLEEQVQERTSALKTANALTQKRADELEIISQVSRVIAFEQNLDKLLPLVTQLISERFNFYHAGIFLLDESQVYAVLRAANSEGGQRMLARGHKLEVGLTGLVGNVAQKGTPRIALDVGEDAAFFNNPDLPDTRSEMALPLNLRGKTIGVLDVQSTQAAAFTVADSNTLTILAEQVAVAIENARLFSETQRALAESQALYQQFIGQTWDNSARKRNQVGYLHSLTGGKLIDQPITSSDINQAILKGEMVVAESQNEPQTLRQANIAMPIKLRDQIIGILNIRSPEKSRTWNQDELAIVQAISERVAFALDNARLLEDSQRRAARERAIGELSNQIGKANDIDTILRSTVEELGKKLRNTEIVIQINKDMKPTSEN